jgi:hypothetical protein
MLSFRDFIKLKTNPCEACGGSGVFNNALCSGCAGCGTRDSLDVTSSVFGPGFAAPNVDTTPDKNPWYDEKGNQIKTPEPETL